MREIYVKENFASKSVLITGATGFVGKILVEKLLRSCAGIEKIYVLLRDKEGNGIQQRFESFISSTLFDDLKKLNPTALQKLVPIEGDLTVATISSEKNVKTLKENVSFVFHCAASMKLEDSLKATLTKDLIGTRNILNLAESFSLLESFVHVSSAFSNMNQDKIFEEIYKQTFDYNKAIEYVEQHKSHEIDEMAKLALKNFHHIYIFSKNLTEHLVSDRSKHLPIAIVRPSIVCPSYEEPTPGYVDTFEGPMGILIGATSGTLRSIYGNGSKVCDLMPVDYVANAIIVASTAVATNENKALTIYNCTSSKQMPITWNQFLELGKEVYGKYPTTKAIWFPGGKMCKHYVVYLIRFLLLQLLPALFIDFLSLVSGKQTWAVGLQRRFFKSLKAYEYFLHSTWEWDNTNFGLLHKIVSIDER